MYTDLFLALLNRHNARGHPILSALVYAFCPMAAHWWLVRRAEEFNGGHPVVGVTPEDLLEALIQRIPRVVGVRDGMLILEDGRVLEVANVIWSTGFIRDYHWIKLPVFDSSGNPIHHHGVVKSEPGLYFVGLPFQSSLLSGLVAGAGADAKYIARQINVQTKLTNFMHGR